VISSWQLCRQLCRQAERRSSRSGKPGRVDHAMRVIVATMGQETKRVFGVEIRDERVPSQVRKPSPGQLT
jgi:hypothetical protein